MQRYKIQEGKSIAEMGCRILCRIIRITCRTLCRIGTKKSGQEARSIILKLLSFYPLIQFYI